MQLYRSDLGWERGPNPHCISSFRIFFSFVLHALDADEQCGEAHSSLSLVEEEKGQGYSGRASSNKLSGARSQAGLETMSPFLCFHGDRRIQVDIFASLMFCPIIPWEVGV
jgi:hypothetical protein